MGAQLELMSDYKAGLYINANEAECLSLCSKYFNIFYMQCNVLSLECICVINSAEH